MSVKTRTYSVELTLIVAVSVKIDSELEEWDVEHIEAPSRETLLKALDEAGWEPEDGDET